MPAEKVMFHDRDILWLECTEWADIPGGQSRVGIAEVNEKTPILHSFGGPLSDLAHIHGIVLLQEGRTATGETWIKVIHLTKKAVVVRPAIDVYSQVAE